MLLLFVVAKPDCNSVRLSGTDGDCRVVDNNEPKRDVDCWVVVESTVGEKFSCCGVVAVEVQKFVIEQLANGGGNGGKFVVCNKTEARDASVTTDVVGKLPTKRKFPDAK